MKVRLVALGLLGLLAQPAAAQIATLHGGPRLPSDMPRSGFGLDMGESLTTTHLLPLVAELGASPRSSTTQPGVGTWLYRVKGDRVVQPARISDDGAKTYIEWLPDQALPAVFGIGPTGKEEVVAGYMRGGIFVIDRVYPELVFRFDNARAKARREKRQG